MPQTDYKKPSSLKGNALYFFSAKFFPALATFLSWMYYSRHLSAGVYGQYQSFWIQLLTLTAVLTLGVPGFVLTYTPEKAVAILRKIKHRQLVFFAGLVTATALIFSFIQNQTNNVSLIQPAVFLLLNISVLLSEALLTTFRSFKALIIINVLFALSFYSAHVYIIESGYRFESLLSLLLILFTLRLLVNIIFCRKAYGLYATVTAMTKEEWTKTKRLWIQMGISDTIQVLFRWIDKFILSFILAKELFAIYVNATIEIPFLPIIFASVSSAALQHWASYHTTQQKADARPTLHFSTRMLSSVVFPLFFFLLIYSREFLIVVFSEQYLAGLWVFISAQLILPVRAYPFTALLQSHHRGDIINKGAFIDFVMACLLMYPLYLLLGLPGVALSFVISTYWQAAYYLRHSARLTGFTVLQLIPLRSLLMKLFICLVLFGGSYLLLQYKHFTVHTVLYTGSAVLLFSSGLFLWRAWHNDTTI